MISDKVKKRLASIVGRENATFAAEDLICYAYDATNQDFRPEGVLFAGTVGEVSEILRLANEEGFFVVPRGAGTGFTGGSLPVKGGIVLSLERMTNIVEIDETNLTATVEPGVIPWELGQELTPLGLFYPPDPTSYKFATIGGTIAECAGGPSAVKYGVTRDYILGLEAVLPTGEIIRTGTATMKGVVGYDLTRLLVGSEGTLAVVTQATLRLLPLPEAKKTLLAVFPGLEAAASAVAEITRAGIIPATLEIMDPASVRCATEYTGTELPSESALLLIEVDGPVESVEKDTLGIEKIAAASGATEVRQATDKKEVKDLWKTRRAMSAALFRLRPNKINEDVVVPRASIVELVRGIEEIARRSGLLIVSFGHAGDGNIHVNIMYDKSDPKEAVAAEAAVAAVFDLTLGLNGTISGEHGVGTSKARYIGMELPPQTLHLMKSIKQVFDPVGILNPGKIFPPHDKEDGFATAGSAR
ncbi:MAG: FAD-binding oxidoreductase [Thermodesulfobacteriota bacterium]